MAARLWTNHSCLLPRPLPEYADWSDLAGDTRWQRLTPRWLLSRQSGLPNWRWLAADQRLRFDHGPGTRQVYSGEGIWSLQTVLEEGLGLVDFDDGDGHAWFKGGHDDFTGNLLHCLERDQRCVLMTNNGARADGLCPHVATLLLGPTRMPWAGSTGRTRHRHVVFAPSIQRPRAIESAAAGPRRIPLGRSVGESTIGHGRQSGATELVA